MGRQTGLRTALVNRHLIRRPSFGPLPLNVRRHSVVMMEVILLAGVGGTGRDDSRKKDLGPRAGRAFEEADLTYFKMLEDFDAFR